MTRKLFHTQHDSFQRSRFRPVVEQLRQNGMYLSDQVMNQALAQVGE